MRQTNIVCDVCGEQASPDIGVAVPQRGMTDPIKIDLCAKCAGDMLRYICGHQAITKEVAAGVGATLKEAMKLYVHGAREARSLWDNAQRKDPSQVPGTRDGFSLEERRECLRTALNSAEPGTREYDVLWRALWKTEKRIRGAYGSAVSPPLEDK